MRTYCVPNLKLDNLIVYSKPETSKLDADRYLMLTLEFIIHHSLHKA